MYLIKVGDKYLSLDGLLVDSQSNALRCDLEAGAVPRVVRLRPHGYRNGDAVDMVGATARDDDGHQAF